MNVSANSLIAAFDEEHVTRLTGISRTQLRYWDRTSFFSPSYSDENRRIPFSRVYSFKDVVALRVLNALRNQFKVSLPHLRHVSAKLSHMADNKWTGVKLYVFNKKVVWIEPGTELPQEIASGQYVVPVVLSDVAQDTEQSIARLRERDAGKVGTITKSRYVSHNAPVVGGTRIPVSAIKAFADAGYTVPQIVSEYPDLTAEDVQAALAYKDSKAAA